MTQRTRQKCRDGAAGADSRRTRRSGAKRKGLLQAGGSVFFVGLVTYGLFVTSVLAGPKAAAEPAPDITLSTADGEFHLSQQRGKVVVLYFSFPG